LLERFLVGDRSRKGGEDSARREGQAGRLPYSSPTWRIRGGWTA
jgi:hypothetical protein